MAFWGKTVELKDEIDRYKKELLVLRKIKNQSSSQKKREEKVNSMIIDWTNKLKMESYFKHFFFVFFIGSILAGCFTVVRDIEYVTKENNTKTLAFVTKPKKDRYPAMTATEISNLRKKIDHLESRLNKLEKND